MFLSLGNLGWVLARNSMHVYTRDGDANSGDTMDAVEDEDVKGIQWDGIYVRNGNISPLGQVVKSTVDM